MENITLLTINFVPEEVHVDDGASHEHVEEVDEDGDENSKESVTLFVEKVPQLRRVTNRVITVRVRQSLNGRKSIRKN